MEKLHNHNNVVGRKKPKMGATYGDAYATVSSVVVNEYTFHLDDELGEVSEYRDLSTILLQAEAHDTINLIINGPGGYLSTCAQLVNLISSSKATVIGHLTGPSASAHTFIFLACHGWVVHPHASMMMHSYSGGVYEKGREIIKSATATQRFFEELVQEVYYPFLTEEEVDSIIDGRDIHLHAKDIHDRIDRVVLHRELEAKTQTSAE